MDTGGRGGGVKICYTAGEYLTHTLLGYIGNVMHIKKMLRKRKPLSSQL